MPIRCSNETGIAGRLGDGLTALRAGPPIDLAIIDDPTVTHGTDPQSGRCYRSTTPCRLRESAMDSDVGALTSTDEDVLTFDAPDDALERAAGVSGDGAMTWVYCTQGWYNCGWPQ
jgi:hypothetical protein